MALTPFNVCGNPNNHDHQSFSAITGNLEFAADRLPGRKLYGAAKHATITHGNIMNIDASKALAEPGVKAVITYEDAPALFDPAILFWGQAVAGIVADDWYTALRAVNLIDVTYEELPAIVDPDEALKPGAPLSGKRADTNIAESSFTRGDINVGFQEAEVQLETSEPWTTTHQHNQIECHEAIAWWVNDHVYVYQATQNPHGVKTGVVNYLEWPMNKVHCFCRATGGGHGDRSSQWEAGVAAFMSRAVGGAPVFFKTTRKHHMLFFIRQHDHRSVYKWGAKKDGTLTACDVQYFVNGSGAGFPTVLGKTYVIPNVRWEGKGIYVNVPNRGAWRCVSDPPQSMNMNTSLDKLATQLDIRPDELRRKNLMPVDMPDQDGTKRIWGSKEVNECFERVYQESGYATKWHKPAQNNVRPDGRLHGIAISCHTDSHGSVSGTSRGGTLLMQADGTCLVLVGGAKATNGSTQMCHIVAEVLGMKYDDVFLGDYANTDVTLSAGGQGGSAFTGGAGSAFVKCAEDARAKLFEVAITKEPFKAAGATVEDLDAKDSVVFLKSDPTKQLTFSAVMQGASPIAGYGYGWAAAGGGMGGGGLQRPLFGNPVGTKVNAQSACASVCEVAVDTETGEVEILGHWNAVGTGRVIFYQGVMQQLGSGTELQVAQALFCGDIYDPATGALIGSQYTESQLPTTMDCKTERHNLYPIEGDDHSAPLGAHGIGEPVVSNQFSIIGAIFNATGKWVDFEHGAANPDRVLKALGKA